LKELVVFVVLAEKIVTLVSEHRMLREEMLSCLVKTFVIEIVGNTTHLFEPSELFGSQMTNVIALNSIFSHLFITSYRYIILLVYSIGLVMSSEKSLRAWKSFEIAVLVEARSPEALASG